MEIVLHTHNKWRNICLKKKKKHICLTKYYEEEWMCVVLKSWPSPLPPGMCGQREATPGVLRSLSRDAASHARGRSPAFLIPSNSNFKSQNYEKMRLRVCGLLSLIPFPSIDWRLYAKCGKLRIWGLRLPQPRSAIEWTFMLEKGSLEGQIQRKLSRKGKDNP